MNVIHKNKATIAAFILTVVLLFQVSLAASATSTVKVESQEVQLVFDGKTLVIPQGQYVFAIKGTNYVPLRFFSYALQKNVNWDSKTGTVSVTEPSVQEAKVLNEYLVNATGNEGQASSKGGAKVAVAPIQAKFNFEGTLKPIPSGQSAYSLSGTIYVPVRFMSQSVGIDIKWNKGGMIQAESPEYKAEQGSGNTGTGGGTTTDPGKKAEPDKETDPNGTPGGGAGGGGGGTLTYESITSSTKESLQSLELSCKNQLMPLGLQLVGATESAVKQQLVSQINGVITQCTTQFNELVAQAEQQLTENGYSTSIIVDYRNAFQAEMDAGRALLEGMSK
jgi:hypothetical protein